MELFSISIYTLGELSNFKVMTWQQFYLQRFTLTCISSNSFAKV